MSLTDLQMQDGQIVAALDWLGNRVAIGDLVLYTLGFDNHGREMAIGELLAFKEEVKQCTSWRLTEPGDTPAHWSAGGTWTEYTYELRWTRALVRTHKSSVTGKREYKANRWISTDAMTSVVGLEFVKETNEQAA